MAFNLMLEFTGPTDWTELRRLARSGQGLVEWFPVPATTPAEPNGLAASVPRRQANDTAWQELHAALQAITAAFPARVINLYDGVTVPASEWPSLRAQLVS